MSPCQSCPWLFSPVLHLIPSCINSLCLSLLLLLLGCLVVRRGWCASCPLALSSFLSCLYVGQSGQISFDFFFLFFCTKNLQVCLSFNFYEQLYLCVLQNKDFSFLCACCLTPVFKSCYWAPNISLNDASDCLLVNSCQAWLTSVRTEGNIHLLL